MKIVSILILVVISGMASANSSSISGIKFLHLLAQLRGLPANTSFDQLVSYPNQAALLDATTQLRFPQCVIKKSAQVGSSLLTEQQLAILVAQIRANNCLNPKKENSSDQVDPIQLNTIRDITRSITASRPNSLISSSLEQVAPDHKLR